MQTKRRDEGPSNLELIAKKAKSEIQQLDSSDMEVANGKPVIVELDEDLHSRQLAVYGREAMRRMVGASILVSGLRGLGVEVAKNIILAGVKSVTIHDTCVVDKSDLSSQFYLTEEDIGKNRAAASADKLAELNKSVEVCVLTENLSEEDLKNFQVVVFTDVSYKEAIRFNNFCRSQKPPIGFVKAEIRGVFGSVFSDFGKSFKVYDVDGEEPFTGIIASISNGNPAFVTCVDDERLHFEDGDLVTFTEIHGMSELNDGKPRRVSEVMPHSFYLQEDTTNYGAYVSGGIVTQHKLSKTLDFKSLQEALDNPGEFLLSDFGKFDRPPLLHVGFLALDLFRVQEGRLPLPNTPADVEKFMKLVKEVNENQGDRKLETLDEVILKHMANGASVDLNPMAAMFGGIVGQEIVKACSGKFHPLTQFFHFDSVESLPLKPLPAEETEPEGGRYDGQIALFGRTFQKKMGKAKLFLIGAGALGCEFLKNFALLGLCTDEGGEVIVTDDDTIEKSNLSRQFLFRDKDIGHPKSTVAASAAVTINPRINIRPLQNRVGRETENLFNYQFWNSVDLVVNALDNVKARIYVDEKCVYYQKALLESGTLGPKCNTQMVIPHETENYGASRDPPEKEAPMCTLHSFPHNIDHCLAWARSEFDGLLLNDPTEANSYLKTPETYLAKLRKGGDGQARQNLERLLEILVMERSRSFQDCLQWARLKFEEYFASRVKQLTFTFPVDSITSTGVPFWSPPKRFPSPLLFSNADSSHLDLLQALAILRAQSCQVEVPDWATDKRQLAKVVGEVPVPEFKPKEGVKIVTDPKATSVAPPSEMDDDAVVDELIARLAEGTADVPKDFKLNPITFEKDQEDNFHMQAVAGLANMRARNYAIPEVDRLKAKLIAGRIVPAIATTTALATGLVCLELLKTLQGHSAELHRNTYANLAQPLFSMYEPVMAKAVEFNGLRWTLWDNWVVEGDPTVQDVLDFFLKRKIVVYSISGGPALLFNMAFASSHKKRLGRKVSELWKEVAKLELPETSDVFEVVVACESEEGEDIDVPRTLIKFR